MRIKVVRKRLPSGRTLHAVSHNGVLEKVATAFGEVDFQHRIITNSMRGTYTTCRRKFWLEYGQRLKLRGTKHYFAVGQWVHKELELMYTSRKFDMGAMRKRINESMKSVLAQAATADHQEKLVHGAAIAMGVCTAYADMYLKHDLARMKFPELEKSFGPFPINGTRWKYSGVRDGMVEWIAPDDRYDAKRGETALLENKTTAAMDANYFARLPIDNQILGYLWAKREEGGKQPTSVLYNVMQKSRLRNKKTESRSQYLDRIVDDYRINRTKYFYREKVLFFPGMLDVFQRSLVDTVNELEWCMKQNTWSMNDRACMALGRCEFFPLCSSGFQDEHAFMLYERREKMHGEVDIDFDEAER